MPKRQRVQIVRLKKSRQLIKGGPEPKTYTSSDFKAEYNFLGINYSQWVNTIGSEPSVYKPKTYTAGDVTQLGYDDEDVAQLLQDIKLLFRADHLVLILETLIPWEHLLGVMGEAFETAYLRFNELVDKIDKDRDKRRTVVIALVSSAIAGGLTALIVSGVGLVPALAVAALGVGAGVVKGVSGKAITTGLSWIEEKIVDKLGKLPKLEESADPRVVRSRLIGVVKDIRREALNVTDVTADQDLFMILDYVYYQTRNGYKVGLNTQRAGITKLGEQQDLERTKSYQLWEKIDKPEQSYDVAYPSVTLAHTQLVRKARNMIEKAFEYQLDLFLEQIALPKELEQYTYGKTYERLATLLELYLWCSWIVERYKDVKEPGGLEEKIKKRLDELVLKVKEDMGDAKIEMDPVPDSWTLCEAWLDKWYGLQKTSKPIGKDLYPKTSVIVTWAKEAPDGSNQKVPFLFI